jgi:hypothetical protein
MGSSIEVVLILSVYSIFLVRLLLFYCYCFIVTLYASLHRYALPTNRLGLPSPTHCVPLPKPAPLCPPLVEYDCSSSMVRGLGIFLEVSTVISQFGRRLFINYFLVFYFYHSLNNFFFIYVYIFLVSFLLSCFDFFV